jgi:hypothetical protein
MREGDAEEIGGAVDAYYSEVHVVERESPDATPSRKAGAERGKGEATLEGEGSPEKGASAERKGKGKGNAKPRGRLVETRPPQVLRGDVVGRRQAVRSG